MLFLCYNGLGLFIILKKLVYAKKVSILLGAFTDQYKAYLFNLVLPLLNKDTRIMRL